MGGYGLTPVESEPPRRRRPLAVAAVSITVVAILIAGVAAVAAITGPATNTPGDAVTGLLTAAGNGDVLGVLDHIDPPERDAVSGFITDGTGELQRLGVLSGSLDLHHLAGVTATYDNLQTTATDLRAGLSAVRVTGTVHSHVDPAQLPVGSFVKQHAGSALTNAGVKDATTPLNVPFAVVTIRRGGTWYVSLGYTIAEAARAAAKAPMPDPQAAVPAVGASSATQAVDEFLRALAAVDVKRLIELTPPDEMGALHEYAPLFLPSVTAALSHAGAFSITITSLDLASTPHNGGELVTIKSVGLRATFGQTTIELAPGAKCPTVTGPSVPDLSALCGGSTSSTAVPPALSGVMNDLSGLHPEVGIVAVEEHGSWYVSPVRTVLDDTESVLHAVPSDFLTKLVGAFNPAAILGATSRMRSAAAIASGSGTLCISGAGVQQATCPTAASGG